MDFLDYSPMYIVKNMFVFGLVSASVFLWTHTYQPFWRYISIEDMPPLFLSAVLSNLIFFPLMLLMNQEDFLPYSVLVINVFALTFILTIPRFLVRMLYNRKKNKLKKIEGLVKIAGSQIENPEVLLVGNSLSAEAFLRDVVLNDDIQFNFEPVGILTLDPQDVGHVIRGVPIIAELRNIHLVLKDLTREGIRPRQIVITEKTLPENAKNFLIRYVKEHKLLLMHIIHQCMFDTVSE
jgi:O-antigen biosynthesis protein WbqV